ncbi:MAG TPA: hypothetical protein DCS13_03160 [Candidatus Margulisbacteria bacterium]|nr:MAG: hypothetical protein A2X43_12770 [Candidatus Margulisbacteria bacterium GWD2_39_127]OGI02103.1 MAG: hypothetical protein A2X42_01385 [Candidatus Margulisbacteria bacterium GWF2_38_17]HAR62440.1 hypothetical protein [Candidatus Margulisiibacteriota bacterium]
MMIDNSNPITNFKPEENNTSIIISANGIDVEIEREIIEVLGIDPRLMNIEIHRMKKEEINIM